MNIIGERIKERRKALGISADDLSKTIGVSRTAIFNYENGSTKKVPSQLLHPIAAALETTVDYLLGKTDNQTLIPSNGRLASRDEFTSVPILGYVRAGVGGAIQQEVIGYELTSRDSVKGESNYFWLQVNGSSMSPRIEEGDLVLVRGQTSVDSGDLAVVIVDGEEGVVKKVYYGDDWIELHSFNPYYPPRRFDGENVLEIQVVGKVVESKRKY